MRTNKSVYTLLTILIGAIAGYCSLSYLIESDFGQAGISRKIKDGFCSQDYAESFARCEFINDVNYRIYGTVDSDLDSRLNEIVKMLFKTTKLGTESFSNISEHDVIREIVLLQTVMKLKRYSHSDEYKSIGKVTRILSKYWRAYPEYVAASACVDCGIHSSSIRELATSFNFNPDYVQSLALGSTRLMGILDDYPLNSIKNLENHFRARAELSYSSHGNLISHQLIQNKDWDGLKVLIHNGPGAYALSNSHHPSIPREIIEQAWIESVTVGDDKLDVTQYLLSTGYRPALRWLVWYVAGNYEYFRGRNLKEKKSMLASNTDFGHLEGAELATYYSKNWQHIEWDSETNQWVTNK